MTTVSIVIPVYYNEGVLPVTMAALENEFISKQPQVNVEVIFVDDGSGDNSFQQLLELRAANPQTVSVIKLTRNFGQAAALMAGLTHSRGDLVIIMSADNQDPAELINDMVGHHINDSFDIVIASRKERDESLFRTWTSKVFYKMMRYLSFSNMPAGGFDYVLLSRRVVNVLLQNQEATPFLQGQILWTGYSTKFVDYRRRKREIGKSRWTLGKKITYLLDGVMGYSFLPIRLMSIVGFTVAILGFAYALVIIAAKLIWDATIEGWAPIMVAILALGGLQMLMLGVIGEYLWRVLAQVRDRAPFVIEAMYERTSASANTETLTQLHPHTSKGAQNGPI